jgi:hypothetical protein
MKPEQLRREKVYRPGHRSNAGRKAGPGFQGNNAFTGPLTSPMGWGERYVSRRQKTRVQDGFAGRLRDGRGGACRIRRVPGPAQRRNHADGAGHATVAVDTRRRNQTVGACRAGDDRRAAKPDSTRTRPSGCRRAEGRRHAGAAAGSSRKDRGTGQGKIASSFRGSRWREPGIPRGSARDFRVRAFSAPRNDFRQSLGSSLPILQSRLCHFAAA